MSSLSKGFTSLAAVESLLVATEAVEVAAGEAFRRCEFHGKDTQCLT